MTENEIGTSVIAAAIAVHRELGPGLLESVYEAVLAHELLARGLRLERQVPVPIEYKGIRFEEGFRADLIVEGKVVLELKSVERVSGAHKKQVQTYLRLTGCKLGYLLNFNDETMRAGITRCVNGLSEGNPCASAPPRDACDAGRFPLKRGGAEGMEEQATLPGRQDNPYASAQRENE